MARLVGLFCAVAAAFGLLADRTARAQEDLTVTKFDVFRYDSLIDGDTSGSAPCCAPHVIAFPDQALLHVSAVFDVPWSDDFSRISISRDEVTLQIGEGEPIEAIGRFEVVGRFEVGMSGLSANRPYDWPERDLDLHVEVVFPVPADATGATLLVGEYLNRAIEIPQTAAAPPAMISTAAFEITNVTVLDRLVTEVGVRDPKTPGAVMPVSGKIVQVDFAFTPTVTNALDGDNDYAFYTSDIQLADPQGSQTVLLGQILSGSLINDTINSFSGDRIIGHTSERTWYFLTDGTAGTYTLFFGADPVSEIEVP